MMGMSASSLLLLLAALSAVKCWQNNLQPKRDTSAVFRALFDAFKNRDMPLRIASSYALTKVLLADPKASAAASEVAPSMLAQRGNSMDSQAYQPGLKLKDVYYPSWFEGRWEASSVFDAVDAPLGEEVFGGKPVLKAAEKDLTSKLAYPVLFKQLMPEQAAIVASGGVSNNVISDRLYNVEQIALASMGPNSIIDDFQKGTVFDIDLIVTDREQSQVSPDTFEALERTAQIITVRARLAVPPVPLRKEIETITSYKKIDPTTIIATQRTATFLSPLDPRYRLAAARDPRVSNTAVDIRKYTVTYKKVG